MGKTIDTYEDVQSLGIETLRNLYTSAGLAIRPKTQINRIEQLKEIIRAWGQNPEEILTKDALMRGNITELPRPNTKPSTICTGRSTQAADQTGSLSVMNQKLVVFSR